MIALASDCLLFQFSSGVMIPLSADMVTVEVSSSDADPAANEYLHEATGAVFYYFKHELRRESVTLAEFSEALEKVIQGFGFSARRANQVLVSDLSLLVGDSGTASELIFFPRLRDELRSKLREEPKTLRFHGLRACVKQLAGATRWSARCETLRDQVVLFLRECISAEAGTRQLSVVVE